MTQQPITQFQWNFAWESSFHSILVSGQILAFHRMYFLFSSCSLGFGEWLLSYYLRYTSVKYCYTKECPQVSTVKPHLHFVQLLSFMLQLQHLQNSVCVLCVAGCCQKYLKVYSNELFLFQLTIDLCTSFTKLIIILFLSKAVFIKKNFVISIFCAKNRTTIKVLF